MRYTIVTVEWLTQHGLLAMPTMRSNADGTKVVLHEEFVNLFPRDSFPTYRMDDPNSYKSWNRKNGITNRNLIVLITYWLHPHKTWWNPPKNRYRH